MERSLLSPSLPENPHPYPSASPCPGPSIVPCTLSLHCPLHPVWSPGDSLRTPAGGLVWRAPYAEIGLWLGGQLCEPCPGPEGDGQGDKARCGLEALDLHPPLDLACCMKAGAGREQQCSLGSDQHAACSLPHRPPLSEAHLGSGLGQGPVLIAPWNLRPSADVSFLGDKRPL